MFTDRSFFAANHSKATAAIQDRRRASAGVGEQKKLGAHLRVSDKHVHLKPEPFLSDSSIAPAV